MQSKFSRSTISIAEFCLQNFNMSTNGEAAEDENSEL